LFLFNYFRPVGLYINKEEIKGLGHLVDEKQGVGKNFL